MGFKNGAYAKIWAVDAKSETATQLRISISRKDKTTDKYETDFSGYVTCYGAEVAAKAAALKVGDKIQLGSVDVSRRYDAAAKREFLNFKVFSFDPAESGSADSAGTAVTDPFQPLEPLTDDEQLPF